MVDFVEQDAGEVGFGFDTDFGAVFEAGFDFDFGGAGDEAVEFRDGKATFVVGLGFASGFNNFGVDKSGEGGGVVFLLHFVADDDNADVGADLRGGHGGGDFMGVGFFPVEGEGAHMSDYGFDTFVNLANFLGLFAQSRVRSGDDFHRGYYSIKI